jgi:hypothetical protein
MANDLIPSQEEIHSMEKLAKYALDSKFFDKMGGIGGIFSIMMYAKELGLSPIQSLFGGMHNVMGKIEIAPVQMNAMIRRAGHRLDILEHDNNKCTIKGTRKESGETCTITFTIMDAKTAGIFKEGSGWTKYPSDMLFARTISRLARRLFPDVIGCMYVEGEIEEVPQEDRKTFSVDPIQEDEYVAEVKQDITVEKSAEILSQFLKIENDESLRKYISSCMERAKSPLSEVTNKWVEKKEKFIEYYNAWKTKQAFTAETLTVDTVSS